MSMDCVIDVDLDYGTGYSETIVTIKPAPHRLRCEECGRTIAPGEMHEHAKGYRYDDALDTEDNDNGDPLSGYRLDGEHVTCSVCLEVRDCLFCGSYYYGEIWEEIHEALFETDDVPLCWFDGLSRAACLSLARTIQRWMDDRDDEDEEEDP